MGWGRGELSQWIRNSLATKGPCQIGLPKVLTSVPGAGTQKHLRNQNLVQECSKTAVNYEYVFTRESKYEFIGEPNEVQSATNHPMNFSNCSHCHLELTPQKTHSFLQGYLWTQKFLCSQHQRLRALHTLSSTQTLCPHPCWATPFQPVAPHRPRAALTARLGAPCSACHPHHSARRRARSQPSSFQAGANQQQCRQGGCARCMLHSLPPRCLGQRNKKEADARKRLAG